MLATGKSPFCPSATFALLSWPNCPESFNPQHLTELSSKMAHACWLPKATAFADPPVPKLIAVSVDTAFPLLEPVFKMVPWPSTPLEPFPQHFSSVVSKIAQTELPMEEVAI